MLGKHSEKYKVLFFNHAFSGVHCDYQKVDDVHKLKNSKYHI